MRSTGFMKSAAAVICLLLASPALAQSATVATYASSATDPNTAKPLSAVTYTPTCNLTPKLPESSPLVNLVEALYDDPANAARDCRVSIAAQFAALPVGAGYKAALKLSSGAFGPFSNAFAVAAQTAPPQIIAGLPFAVSAPHPCTNATAFRLYVDNVQSGLDRPAASCGNGTVLISAVGVSAGTHTISVAAVDAQGELRGPSLTIQANPPRTVAPGTPSVTQP